MSVEMSDEHLSPRDPNQVDVQVLHNGSDSSSPAIMPATSNSPHLSAHGMAHTGNMSLQNVPEHEDFDDGDLPPVKVKEGLTYSLGITIGHEIAGTFMFVYSILAVATAPGATTTDVAFAIAPAAFVYSHVFQKAHFNTWITVYLWLTDMLGRSFDNELIELYPEQYRGATGIPRDSKRAVRFMSFIHLICQLAGSTLASWLIWNYPRGGTAAMGNTAVAMGFFNNGATSASPTTGGVLVVMFLEFIITYSLLYSLDIGDESNHRPGRAKSVFFSVGPPIVLFLGVRTVGDYTGASFNLARTFGPALVSGNWGYGAIGYYAVAQFLAVCMAVTVEQYRFKKHIKNRRKELALIAEHREKRRSAAASRKATGAQSQAVSRKPTHQQY